MPHREEESRVPVLVTPREESIVDARRVRFAWKPVAGASEYRFEVADSPSFDNVVYEKTVTGRTEIVVENELPPDEQTYFWRVVATDENGQPHGEDNIESFISGTREDEDLGLAAPDAEEAFGPAERLLKGAKAEAAAEVTDAPRFVQQESELGVEHEGVEAGQILGLTLATAVALGLAIFTLFQYVDIVAETTRFTAAGVSGYPELREVELEATRRLSQYGVVEGEQNVYQIPIDRAIDLMANEARQQEGEYSDVLNLRPERR